jgi:hypothetical protein
MSREALKLALEALESLLQAHYNDNIIKADCLEAEQAITAIKQALAAQQEPVAENFIDALKFDVAMRDAALVQKPVQEPVAWQFMNGSSFRKRRPDDFSDLAPDGFPYWRPLYTTPPAQEFVCSTGLCHYKAVPDAIGPNEDELPAYAAGWNDCRAEMLKGMKP